MMEHTSVIKSDNLGDRPGNPKKGNLVLSTDLIT